MLGSECIVQNLGYTTPYKLGAQKVPFLTTSQLSVNFNGLYLRKERNIHNWASALETTMGLLHRSKCHELCSTNSLKLHRHFYPPSVNSAFYFIARLPRQGAANRTQPNFVKWCTVNHANICHRKVGSCPFQKIGVQ